MRRKKLSLSLIIVCDNTRMISRINIGQLLYQVSDLDLQQAFG